MTDDPLNFLLYVVLGSLALVLAIILFCGYKLLRIRYKHIITVKRRLQRYQAPGQASKDRRKEL